MSSRELPAVLPPASSDEEDLRAALEELETTYRHAPVGLCVFDRNLRYVRINDRLAAMNGIPPAAHLGRTPREIVPALADKAAAIAERVWRTGEPVRNVEFAGTTAAHPDREGVWREQWYPLRNAAGEITGISVAVEDVTTERAVVREREALLAEAQAAREALERHLRETTALMDAGRALARAVRMDDVLRTLCRVARDIVGADGAVFVFAEGDEVRYAEEDAIGPLWKNRRFPATVCASGWAIADRRTVVIPDVSADPDLPHDAYAPTFVRSLALAPVRRAEPLGALGAYWQVPLQPTDAQVRLLEALANVGAIAVHNARLFEESQDANRRKDEFLAMLGHELRNPLAPILTAVELLRTLQPSEPRAGRAHDIIHRQVVHMTRLVDDLLDVSRITRGRIALRRERVELGGVVADAVEASRPLLEGFRHAIAVDTPAGIWIDGDRARLVQVATNLLTNAAKFTPPGGQVTIRAACTDGSAVLAVRDNGVGIATDVQARIFELFAQEDVTIERSRGGLGIGLTLAKRLVEMHGGTLSVASEGRGKGAEFVVTLPAVCAPVLAPA